MTLALREFHNALRILRNIDRWELEEVGAIKKTGRIQNREMGWTSFKADPYTFFIRADDPTANAIWGLIEARQPKRHPNGAPMFAPDGTMLDSKGNRSIFDDVDQ